MTRLRDRDPVALGVGAAVLILAVLSLAFNTSKLPFVGAGPTYHAAFSEAGGLRAGEEVRIAGVTVGSVSRIGLSGSHVVVDFHVKGHHFGTESTASVEVKTLLGSDYLAIQPAGTTRMRPGGVIPLGRTTPPFDVVPAFEQLGGQLTQINTTELAKSLTTLADTFRDTPPEVASTLTGLTRLSATIASRDQQIGQLLNNTAGVSSTLASNDTQITQLITSTNTVLALLDQRSSDIDALLRNTQALSTQLEGLVADNEKTLGPALAQLTQVSTTLEKDKGLLTTTISKLSPFVNVFSDVIGTGGYFDSTLSLPQGETVCDTHTGSGELSTILDPVLSQINKGATGSSAPCLPLAPSGTGK